MPDSTRMQELSEPFATVSDRIRVLHRHGYSRGEIADFLGKRYQHVRNVLVDDERRRAGKGGARGSGNGEGAARLSPPRVGTFEGSILRLRIGEDGSVRLPADVQARLGYRPGGVIVAETMEDRCVFLSSFAALDRARQLVREIIPGEDSLAESLIADRRAEAEADA